MEKIKKRKSRYTFRRMWNAIEKAVAKATAESQVEINVEIAKMRQETDSHIAQLREEAAVEIAKMREETAKIREETAKIREETAKIREETAKMHEETEQKIAQSKFFVDEMFEKRDAEMKTLKTMVFGIGENIGQAAEEYFFSYFREHLEVDGITYKSIERNRYREINGLGGGEYDIILINDENLLVIEVKYKFHPKDVLKFSEKKLETFKKLFPEYKDRSLRGAIASFTYPETSINVANRCGLIVFQRVGRDVKIKNTSNTKIF